MFITNSSRFYTPYSLTKYFNQDGVNDVFRVPFSELIYNNTDTPFTYSYYGKVPSGHGNAYFGGQWGSSTAVQVLLLRLIAGGQVQVIIGGGTAMTSTETVSPNVYHLITVKIDIVNSLVKVFVDGVELTLDTQPTETSFPRNSGSAVMTVGGMVASGFQGTAWDTVFGAYHNVALSDADIVAMYGGGEIKEPQNFAGFDQMIDAGTSTWDGSKFVDTANGNFFSVNMAQTALITI